MLFLFLHNLMSGYRIGSRKIALFCIKKIGEKCYRRGPV